MLAGTLDLWVSNRTFRLEAGHSFSFKSTEVQRCANPADIPTPLLGVTTPPHD